MAAFATHDTSADRQSACGVCVQFFGIIFLGPLLRYLVFPEISPATQQLRIQETRQGLIWTGCFIVAGWLLQQWEAGRWPGQAKILALWETRMGNFALTLALAAELALVSLLAINALLWLITL